MFRLFSRLSAGRHTTGSAATRRGLAGRPQRMFSRACPAAPGELMEIDSTPLDVMVMLDDGVPGRVELTGMIDVATRTVPAAVRLVIDLALDTVEHGTVHARLLQSSVNPTVGACFPARPAIYRLGPSCGFPAALLARQAAMARCAADRLEAA